MLEICISIVICLYGLILAQGYTGNRRISHNGHLEFVKLQEMLDYWPWHQLQYEKLLDDISKAFGHLNSPNDGFFSEIASESVYNAEV